MSTDQRPSPGPGRNRASRAALLAVALLALAGPARPQGASLGISGYVDAYCAQYDHHLPSSELQPFSNVSPRSRAFGLNIAQVGLRFVEEKARATLVIHQGDIVRATWSQTFPALQAANVGFRMAKGLWLDAGFFPTHIGTESFLPMTDKRSSTTLATFHEPSDQAGVCLRYEGNEALTAQLWVVNGYNHFMDANRQKSVGLLLGYALPGGLSLAYSNLLGVEASAALPAGQGLRAYHNLYLVWQAPRWVRATLGGDFGSQARGKLDGTGRTATLRNALFILTGQFHPSFSMTLRWETFQDPEGIVSGIVPTDDGSPRGLEATGWTLGAEYLPHERTYLRLEGRRLQTPEGLAVFDPDHPRTRWEIMATLGHSFELEAIGGEP